MQHAVSSGARSLPRFRFTMCGASVSRADTRYKACWGHPWQWEQLKDFQAAQEEDCTKCLGVAVMWAGVRIPPYAGVAPPALAKGARAGRGAPPSSGGIWSRRTVTVRACASSSMRTSLSVTFLMRPL